MLISKIYFNVIFDNILQHCLHQIELILTDSQKKMIVASHT